MEANKQRDRDCFNKAVAKDELTFTVREQDLTSPETICEWIKLNINSCPAEKLEHALAVAIAMRNSKIKRKLAD